MTLLRVLGVNMVNSFTVLLFYPIQVKLLQRFDCRDLDFSYSNVIDMIFSHLENDNLLL